MTQIDFYILPDKSSKTRLIFACRLIEKAWKQNHQIYIHTKNQSDAETVDQLLWTFREDSFIPHNFYGDLRQPIPPIQIGFAKNPETHHDILLNLHPEVPAFHSQFKRILEIVTNDTEEQQLARERYRIYRDAQLTINTHKLDTI